MAHALAEVRAAAGFLTRLPVGGVSDRVGAAAFGVVGAGIGLLAAVPLVLLGRPVPLVAAVLAVSVIVLVTGAVHIDGLADTADALAAPSADAAERARNDPRLGSGGVATHDARARPGDRLPGDARRAGHGSRCRGRGRGGHGVEVRRAGGGPRLVEDGSCDDERERWCRGVVRAARRSARDRGGGRHIARGGRGRDRIAGPAIALGSVGGVAAGAAIAAWVLLRRGQLDGDGYGAVIELVFVAMLSGIAVAGSLR